MDTGKSLERELVVIIWGWGNGNGRSYRRGFTRFGEDATELHTKVTRIDWPLPSLHYASLPSQCKLHYCIVSKSPVPTQSGGTPHPVTVNMRS